MERRMREKDGGSKAVELLGRGREGKGVRGRGRRKW